MSSSSHRATNGTRKRPRRMRVKKYNVDVSNSISSIDMAGRVNHSHDYSSISESIDLSTVNEMGRIHLASLGEDAKSSPETDRGGGDKNKGADNPSVDYSAEPINNRLRPNLQPMPEPRAENIIQNEEQEDIGSTQPQHSSSSSSASAPVSSSPSVSSPKPSATSSSQSSSSSSSSGYSVDGTNQSESESVHQSEQRHFESVFTLSRQRSTAPSRPSNLSVSSSSSTTSSENPEKYNFPSSLYEDQSGSKTGSRSSKKDDDSSNSSVDSSRPPDESSRQQETQVRAVDIETQRGYDKNNYDKTKTEQKEEVHEKYQNERVKTNDDFDNGNKTGSGNEAKSKIEIEANNDGAGDVVKRSKSIIVTKPYELVERQIEVEDENSDNDNEIEIESENAMPREVKSETTSSSTVLSLADQIAASARSRKEKNSELQNVEYYDRLYDPKTEVKMTDQSLSDHVAAAALAVKLKNRTSPMTEEDYDKLYKQKKENKAIDNSLADQIAATALAKKKNKSEADYEKFYQKPKRENEEPQLMVKLRSHKERWHRRNLQFDATNSNSGRIEELENRNFSANAAVVDKLDNESKESPGRIEELENRNFSANTAVVDKSDNESKESPGRIEELENRNFSANAAVVDKSDNESKESPRASKTKSSSRWLSLTPDPHTTPSKDFDLKENSEGSNSKESSEVSVSNHSTPSSSPETTTSSTDKQNSAFRRFFCCRPQKDIICLGFRVDPSVCCLLLTIFIVIAAAVGTLVYFLVFADSRNGSENSTYMPSSFPSLPTPLQPTIPIILTQSPMPSFRPPTNAPLNQPERRPVLAPTVQQAYPTISPTNTPIGITQLPTQPPTMAPATSPTMNPTMSPTSRPQTLAPTNKPPTMVPTNIPTNIPTMAPTNKPPTMVPTMGPTMNPTMSPTSRPQTLAPTNKPPTMVPTNIPTMVPTNKPPTMAPTMDPTMNPTMNPTMRPTSQPQTLAPTNKPPTMVPTNIPTMVPTDKPPTLAPTNKPQIMTPTKKPAPLENFLQQFIKSRWPILGSPQSKALEWLLNSPSDGYSEQQLMQRFVMATFFFSTDGSNWLNNEGWLSTENECDWYQAKEFRDNCDPSGSLVNLELGENGLSGSLPPELAFLSNSLTRLDLANNAGAKAVISGNLPSEIGMLTKLQYISLRENQMSGTLPNEIGKLSLLTVLDLEDNNFEGSLTTNIGNLKQLNNLYLGLNNLSGVISSEVGRLQFLVNLDLHGNMFSSTLPSELGELSILRSLNLSSNNLSGPIPNELDQLVNLGNLQLQNNLLTGSIPSSFYKLSQLQILQLQYNNLIGEVTDAVCDALVRTKIDSGIVPTSILTDCLYKVDCECCQYCCADGVGCECQFRNTNQEFLCRHGDTLSSIAYINVNV